MRDKKVEGRGQALAVAETLRRRGVIRNINKTLKDQLFADDGNTFYKFRKDAKSTLRM